MSRRLRISRSSAESAVKYICAVGYLVEKSTATGIVLKKTHRKLRIPTHKSHPAVRSFHRQMISKALHTLDTQTTDEAFQNRLISGLTFSGDPKKIQAAREKLSVTLYEIAEFLADGDCGEVFQLNCQLFPLTR